MEKASQYLATLFIEITCCTFSTILIYLVLNTPVLEVWLIVRRDYFAEEYCSFWGILFQYAAECFNLSAYIIPLIKTFDCYSPQILQIGSWLRDRVSKVFKYKNDLSNLTEGVWAKERKQIQAPYISASHSNHPFSLLIWSFPDACSVLNMLKDFHSQDPIIPWPPSSLYIQISQLEGRSMNAQS